MGRFETKILTQPQNPKALMNQPRGQQLKYRVKAVNLGGESIPPNTVALVL